MMASSAALESMADSAAGGCWPWSDGRPHDLPALARRRVIWPAVNAISITLGAITRDRFSGNAPVFVKPIGLMAVLPTCSPTLVQLR